MVTMVLLKLAFTWATPEVMFLRSLRRTRATSAFANFLPSVRYRRCRNSSSYIGPSEEVPRRPDYFFLPAIGLAGPLRVRALVCVRWPRTGSERRGRRPREEPRAIRRLMFIDT